MKHIQFYIPLILLIVLNSCTNDRKMQADQEQSIITENKIEQPDFQNIIDAAKIKGAILVYDFQKEIYYSNDFEWANKGKLPASTFKVPNSIIALETGVVEDAQTLFKWDGQKRAIKNWEQDLIFRDAFHFSCVPCYQDVARRIGGKRMKEYLKKLNYDGMTVDSNNIDMFWLEGESRITQFQQIDFLQRFYEAKLPISERTFDMMRKMMVMEEKDNYKLSGKTGWSISGGNDNGWFIGFVETGDKVYFFATNVEPTEAFDMKEFPNIRKEVRFRGFATNRSNEIDMKFFIKLLGFLE